MGGESNGVYGDLDNQAVFRFVHIVAFIRSTFNIKNLPSTWNIAEIVQLYISSSQSIPLAKLVNTKAGCLYVLSNTNQQQWKIFNRHVVAE